MHYLLLTVLLFSCSVQAGGAGLFVANEHTVLNAEAEDVTTNTEAEDSSVLSAAGIQGGFFSVSFVAKATHFGIGAGILFNGDKDLGITPTLGLDLYYFADPIEGFTPYLGVGYYVQKIYGPYSYVGVIERANITFGVTYKMLGVELSTVRGISLTATQKF